MHVRAKLGHYLRVVVGVTFGLIALAVVVLTVAWALDYNVIGWLLTSATPVVKLVGDKLPAFNTRYGRIQLHSHETQRGLEVEAICEECRIQDHLVSSQPFTPGDARVTGVVKGKHFVGDVRVESIRIAVDVQWDGESTRGSVELPPTPIKDLYHAIRSIVPEADKAQITGAISGKGTFVWPDFQLVFEPRIEDFTVTGLVDPSRYRSGRFSYRAKDERGEEIQVESGEGTPRWMPLNEIGKFLPDAIMAIEDQAFYNHHGYVVQSMVEASRFNRRKGMVKRGGSTLTQQLAKNLFLTDERTYARKFRELLYAVEIDHELGKPRVLELYLNVVEWGPGIFGAKSASTLYFDRPPGALRPEQAAWLASILRSPKRAYRRQFQRDQVQEELVRRALDNMQKLTPEERAAALARPVQFGGPR